MLRAIYAFHRLVNGWNDIGYNFVIDRFGRTFEARAGGIDEAVVGAHAGGYNHASTGIAVLGSFSTAPISPAAYAAPGELLAWKLPSTAFPPGADDGPREPRPARSTANTVPARAFRSADRGAPRRGQHRMPRRPPLRTAARAARACGDPRPVPNVLTIAATPPSAAPPGERPRSEAKRRRREAAPTPGTAVSITGTLAAGPPTGAAAAAPIAGATILVQARFVSARGRTVLEQAIARGGHRRRRQVGGERGAPGHPSRADRAARPLRGGGRHGACVSERRRSTRRGGLTPPEAPAPTASAARPRRR